MRAVLIANANAGQRKRDEFTAIVDSMAGELAQEQHWTAAPGDAERLAREITSSGEYDTIIVAGGDGTINEVASGIMSAEMPAGKQRPAIGIVPMGTCNVLANELGLLSLGPSGIKESLRIGLRRAMDVGIAADRYFLLMASYGFDATAVSRVALPIKGMIGPHAYLLSALATLANYQPSKITMHVDDDIVHMEAYMVLVANVSSYAYQQMKLAPFAAIDDGWLDICVFEKAPVAKIGFVTQFFLMLAHRHLHDPRVRYYRARRITISSQPSMLGQIDGDTYGETPVTIELSPKALEFIIPNIYQ